MGLRDRTDGRLSVGFAEKPPKDWIERLQSVTERLAQDGSGWGAIEVGKRKLHVDDVHPGDEADLHHFLESALLQANARSENEEAEDSPASHRSERDQALTDAFRAFANS